MKEIAHTVKLKIGLGAFVAQELTNVFTDACNFVSTAALTSERPNNSISLVHLTYTDVREKFKLGAQLAQTVCRVVSGKYQSAKSNKHKLSAAPLFKDEPPQFQHNRDWSFVKGKREVSIWTTYGRLKVNYYQDPKRLEKYLNLSNGWVVGGATLTYTKSGDVFLAVSFSKLVEEKSETGVVGIDLGIRHIATLSDGAERTKGVRFFDEANYVKQRKHLRNKRAEVQTRKATRNTHSLRRYWKRLSGKEANLTKDTMHRVSKNIVRFAKTLGSPVLVFEDLSGIKKSKVNHGWSFYMLKNMVEYKAAEAGIKVTSVDPAYTSQKCSNCGNVCKASRQGGIYKCINCGFEINSDLNAAKNIRMRYIVDAQEIVQRQVSLKRGCLLNQPNAHDVVSNETSDCGNPATLVVGC